MSHQKKKPLRASFYFFCHVIRLYVLLLTVFLYCHSEYSPLSPILHLPTAFFPEGGKANR